MYHSVESKAESMANFFAITETIGEGSSGIVRKAVKRETGEEFAVKSVDKSQLSDDDFQVLQLEIEILSHVDHPNIVKTYDIYDEPTHVHIVMELMSGGELFERVSTNQIVERDHYSEKEASNTIRPIIDAVQYCHQMGIVHRDLKPENLLYATSDPHALIKISDFGLARFNTDDLMTTACGTPSYVAPEILLGRGYGPEVDFWSIGVILYILLCGFPPFYEDSNEVLFETIKSGQFEFPSPFWDNISQPAKDLIRNCLKVNPRERFGATEILGHEWMTSRNTPRVDMPEVSDKIREFNARRRLQKSSHQRLSTDFSNK